VQEDTEEWLSYLSADGGVEGVSDGLTVALGVGVAFDFDHSMCPRFPLCGHNRKCPQRPSSSLTPLKYTR